MIQKIIWRVVAGHDLSEEEAASVMTEIMEGRATDAQIGCFLTALRLKGETIEEITGCARVMREKATLVDAGEGRLPVVDTCGTGGTQKGTFNVSTAAAIVVAGAGVRVAKHGNRGVSSRSGSADVLKILGVNLDATPDIVSRCIAEANIGFLFAPRLHAAMKHAIGPRREIGIRTVFNVLGPLTNPAGALCQVMGVYDAGLTEPLAHVLKNLGSRHCFVVHSLDGMDEITITAPTQVAELVNGEVKTYELEPEAMGLPRASVDTLLAESPEESAGMIRGILAGDKGPCRDIVLANASAALVAAGAAADLARGVAAAADSIDSGRAREALEKLIACSQAK